MSRGFPLWHSQLLDRVLPPWLAKLVLSSHEPLSQWNQAPVTLIFQWKNKGERDGGKIMIQRLNKESVHQENTVLSTWTGGDANKANHVLLVVNCAK